MSEKCPLAPNCNALGCVFDKGGKMFNAEGRGPYGGQFYSSDKETEARKNTLAELERVKEIRRATKS
jgi:hypothetical protein